MTYCNKTELQINSILFCLEDKIVNISLTMGVSTTAIRDEVIVAIESEKHFHGIENLTQKSVKFQYDDYRLTIFYTTQSIYQTDVRLDFTVKNGKIKYFGRRERYPADSDTRWK